jgi:hypothetical protein
MGTTKTKNHFQKTIIPFLLAMCVLAWPSFAQEEDSANYGNVIGIVLGKDGMPLANATIRIEQLATNGAGILVERTLIQKTGKDGRYSLRNIQISRTPGEVRLRVSVVIDDQSVMIRGEAVGDELRLMRAGEITVDFDLRKAPVPSTAPAPPPSGLQRQ